MSATPSSSVATGSSTSNTLDLATSTSTATATTGSGTGFFTDSFPSPSSTGSGNDNNDPTNLATSTSLYLFTFLATLLLLLAISCAIVIRSFIIRRRFQRRVQEALADGVPLPPPPGFLGGRRRPDFGEKPKMWEAHLAPPDAFGSKEAKWDSLVPVSVRIISNRLTGSGQQIPPIAQPRPSFFGFRGSGSNNNNNNNNNDNNNNASNTDRPRWRPHFFHWRSHPPEESSHNSDNNADADGSGGEAETRIEDAKLQAGVLIAMPSPYRPRGWQFSDAARRQSRNPYVHVPPNNNDNDEDEDEDEELPDVVLGTTEVPWKVVVPAKERHDANANANVHTGGGFEAEREP